MFFEFAMYSEIALIAAVIMKVMVIFGRFCPNYWNFKTIKRL